MKTHVLHVIAFLFLITGLSALHADSKGVAIAAYTTEKAAQNECVRLERIIKNDTLLAKLRTQENFTPTVNRSGKFHVVSIEPFSDNGNAKSALKALRNYYADSYIVNAHKETKPIAKPVVEAPAVQPVASMPHVEEIDIQEEDDINERDAETEVPEPATVDEKPLVTAEPEPATGLGLLPMIIAGVVILLVLLVIYLIIDSRRRRSALDQTDVSAAEAVLQAHETTPEEPVQPEKAAEQEEAEAAKPAETPEKMAEEEPEPTEAAPAPSSRQKREPLAGRGPVSKESLKDFAGMRILVAEDNMINQKVINGLFADSGVEITMANDGQEALNILEGDTDFALVLMDAHMPIIDGLEATRQIRANPEYDAIAVIALSGDTAADDIRKMTEAGMEGHLEKPIKVDALYDVLYCYQPGEEGEEILLPSTLELLSDDGLDVAGGDVELYREILSEFSQMYANSDETLNGLLAKEDYEAARRLLLDVHGVAANIGATLLSDVAETLREAILAKDEAQYMKLAESYHKHLQALLRDIDKI